MEETVVFSPGPVGLQLEEDSEFGSRVIRFMDGGPFQPGPARACGKIQPGDWITRVQVVGTGEEAAASTYQEIMKLLQQAQLTRKITIRSFAKSVLGVRDNDDHRRSPILSNNGTNNRDGGDDDGFHQQQHARAAPLEDDEFFSQGVLTESRIATEKEIQEAFQTFGDASSVQPQGRLTTSVSNDDSVITSDEVAAAVSVNEAPVSNDTKNDFPDDDGPSTTKDQQPSTALVALHILLMDDCIQSSSNSLSHLIVPSRRRKCCSGEKSERRRTVSSRLLAASGMESAGVTYIKYLDPLGTALMPIAAAIANSTTRVSDYDSTSSTEFVGMVELPSKSTAAATAASDQLSTRPTVRFGACLPPATTFNVNLEERRLVPRDTKMGVVSISSLLTEQHAEDLGLPAHQDVADDGKTIALRQLYNEDDIDIWSVSFVGKVLLPSHLKYVKPTRRVFPCVLGRECYGNNGALRPWNEEKEAVLIIIQQLLWPKRQQEVENSRSEIEAGGEAPHKETYALASMVTTHSNNGGGDCINTDSNLEVLSFGSVENGASDPEYGTEDTKTVNVSSQSPKALPPKAMEVHNGPSSLSPPLAPALSNIQNDDCNDKKDADMESSPVAGDVDKGTIDSEKQQSGKDDPKAVKASSPSSNVLLQKAKAKHQLSLARLRVKKQFHKRDLETVVEPTKPSNDNPSNAAGVITDIQEQHGMVGEGTSMVDPGKEKDLERTAALSISPVDTTKPAAHLLSTPASIDFSQFSREQYILLEPGPVGMQLEQHMEYPAKIVRFVDGGPQDPGQARQSGKLRPGDYVVRVEAEGIVGTTYFTILHLLQKSWTTRKLTFRSAWDPTSFGGTPAQVTHQAHDGRPLLPAGTTLPSGSPDRQTGTSSHKPPPRQSPLRESSPLPFDWTPLPFDWVYKRQRHQPQTPEERRALEKAYDEEATRIVRQREELKKRQEEERRLQLSRRSWNFEEVMIGAVAVTVESVAGCFKKQRQYDDDSDEEQCEDDGHKKTE